MPVFPVPVQLPAQHHSGKVTVDVSTENKTGEKVLVGDVFVQVKKRGSQVF